MECAGRRKKAITFRHNCSALPTKTMSSPIAGEPSSDSSGDENVKLEGDKPWIMQCSLQGRERKIYEKNESQNVREKKQGASLSKAYRIEG